LERTKNKEREENLVGLFVGFCALIVVVQLVPTLMLLVGAVRGFFRKSPDQKLGQGV
jgi:uncharacterized membrane protein